MYLLGTTIVVRVRDWGVFGLQVGLLDSGTDIRTCMPLCQKWN